MSHIETDLVENTAFQLLAGIKTELSKSYLLGIPGETILVESTRFRIAQLMHMPLEMLCQYRHRANGYETAEDMRRAYDPHGILGDRCMIVHTLEKVI